jgi:quercetin dioxygenase-like cupin family protein
MSAHLHLAAGVRRIEPSGEGWGSMLWLMEDRLVPGAGVSVARMTVDGGATSPAHRHPDCGETIVLLHGHVTCRIDGKDCRLAAGDAAFVPAGAVHCVRNDGDSQAVLLLAYASGARRYEAVVDP